MSVTLVAAETERVSRRYTKTETDFKKISIKPRILETEASNSENFLRLSDGFKRVFSNDRLDQQMTMPVAGYSGH